LWLIPSVPRFQRLNLAYYRNRGLWVNERTPSLQTNHERFEPNRDAFWYRGGGQVVFSGAAVGELIAISWYEYPRRLIYYPANHPNFIRPANWNPETESFEYAPSFDTTPELRAEAELLTSHW